MSDEFDDPDIAMSDSKKPTVSEIRARRKEVDIIYEARAKFPHLLPGPSQMDKDNEYLLDLVSRMRKALDAPMGHFETTVELASDTNTEFIVFWQRWLEEARALLLELKQ